jgi:hypothetical protein
MLALEGRPAPAVTPTLAELLPLRIMPCCDVTRAGTTGL